MGTTTIQLQKLLNLIVNEVEEEIPTAVTFVGPCNSINTLTPLLAKDIGIDNKEGIRVALIFNTHTGNLPGEHWVGVAAPHFSHANKSLYFFDSFLGPIPL